MGSGWRGQRTQALPDQIGELSQRARCDAHTVRLAQARAGHGVEHPRGQEAPQAIAKLDDESLPAVTHQPAPHSQLLAEQRVEAVLDPCRLRRQVSMSSV